MAGIDADIWVCGECRSVNNLRSKQCYQCRTPRDLAAVDPSEIEGTGHGKLREIALPEFHGSRGEALLASALILGVAGLQLVSTVFYARLVLRVLSDGSVTSAEIQVAGILSIVAVAFALFALTAWAFWLSRIVTAMPALGLGYPAANALMAFVENFLPGLNLFRVPAIVRDVVRRIDPGQNRGDVLIFAAWIALLGGFVIPRLGAYLDAFGADTLDAALRNEIVVEGVSTGLVVVGAIFLVVLIWWIEGKIAERRAEQLEGTPASASGAQAAPAAPRSIAEAAAAVGDPRPAAPTGPTAPDLHRPITAATGAASIPGPLDGPSAFAAPPRNEAPPAPPPATETPPPEVPSAFTAPPATPPAEASPMAVPVSTPSPPAEPLVAAPSGPRLHLRVESGMKMIATLDGASEAITLTELHAAATALARADGSAVIAPAAASFEARSLASEAHEILKDARVPTTLED